MGRVSGLCVGARITSLPITKMNEMPLDFAALALDCEAALGLSTPVNPTAGYTTISIYAGDALNLNPWGRRLDGM